MENQVSDQSSRAQEVKEGAESVAEELYEQAEQAILIGRSKKLSNRELLPSELIVGNSIHSDIKERIQMHSENVLHIMKGVAYYIEEQSLRDTASSMKKLKEGRLRFDQERIDGILEAQGSIRLSYSTLKVVVEIFSAVNRRVIEEMRAGGSLKGVELTELYLKNAIVIYELSAFVYDYISRFSMVGLSDLKKIGEEVSRDIERGRQGDVALKRSISDGSEAMRQSVAREIEHRNVIRDRLKKKWGELLSRFDGAKIDSHHVADIRIIRDNMRNRIDILNLVATTNLVEGAIEKVDNLADLIRGWEIPDLDADAVKGLLDVDGL